jgi:DNA-binding response OmpR family regulator
MTILVAEDDRDIAELIGRYLQKSGWTPHLVASGDAALAYARQHPVDLAILDVMLPGMSGLELCRALRSNRATAHMPIIIVTARAEETDRIVGLEIGADDYIAKPFSPNRLVARIRALIRRSQRGEPRKPRSYARSSWTGRATPCSTRGATAGSTARVPAAHVSAPPQGRVLSRDVLLGDVWGYHYTGGTHRGRARAAAHEKLPVLVDAW